MINTIIIDDEVHCIRRLNNLLKEYCKDNIHLLGAYENIEEGLSAIKGLRPGLVFLDVQLNEKTGFDMLREIKDITFELIFTTAYEKYAVQAFKFSAIDYLLKPIDPDDLLTAVNKVAKKISGNEMAKKMDVLFHNLKNIHAPRKISIPTVDGLIFIEVNDIIRCQSNINYTTIYLKNNQKITVAKTLKEFDELLSDYNFYRVHNSHLINLACIKKYNKNKGGHIQMSDDSEIQLSSRRKDDFIKKLSKI